jgi:ribosomal protein S14
MVNLRIIKEKVKLKKKTEVELITKISKSLYNNLNLINKKRFIFKYIIRNKRLKSNKSICIIGGRYRSVNRKFSMNRHTLNLVNRENPFVGLRSLSW